MRQPALIAIAGPAILLASAAPARAHGGETLHADNVWSAWHLTPDISIPVTLIVLAYAAGLVRRRRRAVSSRGRHTAFFAGVATIFLALQSPIDPLAERLFFVHQIQHLLLMTIGPALLTGAAPAALLVAGLLDVLSLADERLGGLILWIPTSVIFLALIFIMLARWFREFDRALHGAASPTSEGDRPSVAGERGASAR